MNIKILERLSDLHGTSFYIFYPERFLGNMSYFQRCLLDYYPKSQLAYALKANYMPILCALLNEHGYWGEVVSGMEYEIARMQLPANRLIFNGPCKSREEIGRALREGAVVNLDSFYEIDNLETIAHEFNEGNIGLRVSYDIGAEPSRFGFNYENGELSRALKRLECITNTHLVSIHSHFTTRERSLEIFKRRVKGMVTVYESIPEPDRIQYINLGGGFFGPMSEKAKGRLPAKPPSFDEYAALIGGIMAQKFRDQGPYLVLEPGVSMIADAMDYVVKVLDEKIANENRYLTVDGSVNCLFPTGSKYFPDYSEVCAGRSGSRKCHIAGYTCMEHDILLGDVYTSAQPGDYFIFHNRGAYSNVYKPPFIKEAPAIVGLDGTVYAQRQTTQQVTAPYFI